MMPPRAACLLPTLLVAFGCEADSLSNGRMQPRPEYSRSNTISGEVRQDRDKVLELQYEGAGLREYGVPKKPPRNTPKPGAASERFPVPIDPTERERRTPDGIVEVKTVAVSVNVWGLNSPSISGNNCTCLLQVLPGGSVPGRNNVGWLKPHYNDAALGRPFEPGKQYVLRFKDSGEPLYVKRPVGN